ncbi:MAG: ABC transporter permease [Actinomycetota bacterium]|nr:ABC transporter permease [Actinomycetota bacterium]
MTDQRDVAASATDGAGVVTDPEEAPEAPADGADGPPVASGDEGPGIRSSRRASLEAFRALLLRDLYVLRKDLKQFLPRTIMQPVLLMFVFTYVFPKIGQGPVADAGEQFSTVLVAGVVALSMLFQGIQAVALTLVNEFGTTKEIEDRVLAPIPVAWVAVQKVATGALNALFAAAIVFPVAAVVPATDVRLDVSWPVLVTLLPLAAVMSAALGLTFGTFFEPRQVSILFGIIILPITFLGGIYYPWTALDPIEIAGVPWLKILVLANPLLYVCEGLRAALTSVDHMSLVAVYPALVGFTALFLWRGIAGFRRRVLT